MTCATCAHWSATLPPLATGTRRPLGANREIGTCTASPPIATSSWGMTVSVFPETHCTRTCGRWTPVITAGPGDGERVVAMDGRRAAA